MKKTLVKSFALGAGFLALTLTTGAVAPPVNATPKEPTITVYKDPSCGCCKSWIAHLIKHGYRVDAKDTPEMAEIKRTLGIPEALASCHTAVVNGYLIEGHVPADLVKKLLAEKPAGVKGLAAPGMPASAPGMDMPGQHYTIYSFDAQGHSKIYAQR